MASTVWVTSDLHLSHRNIIKYCRRPFIKTIDGFTPTHDELDLMCKNGNDEEKRKAMEHYDIHAMNKTIIDNINLCVKPNDELWILGDFCMGDPLRFLDQIICKNLNFVIGSHDKDMWKYQHSHFKIFTPKMTINIHNRAVTVTHEPMMIFSRSHYGSHHWFGHCHTKRHYHLRDISEIKTDFDRVFYRSKSIDVGVDGNNFMPWNSIDLINICDKKEGYLLSNRGDHHNKGE